MSQQESDEKKLERIRKMLDNPTAPSSHSGDDRYMAGLQRRLMGENIEKHPIIHQYSSDKPDDLKPSVIIHHRKEPAFQSSRSELTTVEVKEKTKDELPVFPDEELFEIERPDESSIPEFIEVKPLKEEKEDDTVSIADTKIIEKEESLDDLPQWKAVEEEIPTPEPEVLLEQEKEEIKEEKTKSKPLRASKRSVVIQDSKEPEIWEGGDEDKQTPEKKPDSSAWEPVEAESKGKKRAVKTKKKLVFARFDKRSMRKKDKIASKQKEEEFIGEKSHKVSSLQDKHGYTHGEYTLYKKELRIGGKEVRTVHFFSKDAPEDSKPCDLPNGYEVQVNEKTGVPYIRKMK